MNLIIQSLFRGGVIVGSLCLQSCVRPRLCTAPLAALSFDFCCSYELHGYTPDTSGCGLFKLVLMQTPVRFKYAVSFFIPAASWRGAACTCMLRQGALRSLAGLLVLHLFEATCHWGLKSPCKSCYLAPVQRIRGLSDQHIYHLWTYGSHPVPRAKSSPPLHHRLIFCVSELWIVVLPHCNKQMAARSWVITKPLREWLVLSRAALIRAQWLSPVFAQALKSSSGFVTRRVCSG